MNSAISLSLCLLAALWGVIAEPPSQYSSISESGGYQGLGYKVAESVRDAGYTVANGYTSSNLDGHSSPKGIGSYSGGNFGGVHGGSNAYSNTGLDAAAEKLNYNSRVHEGSYLGGSQGSTSYSSVGQENDYSRNEEYGGHSSGGQDVLKGYPIESFGYGESMYSSGSLGESQNFAGQTPLSLGSYRQPSYSSGSNRHGVSVEGHLQSRNMPAHGDGGFSNGGYGSLGSSSFTEENGRGYPNQGHEESTYSSEGRPSEGHETSSFSIGNFGDSYSSSGTDSGISGEEFGGLSYTSNGLETSQLGRDLGSVLPPGGQSGLSSSFTTLGGSNSNTNLGGKLSNGGNGESMYSSGSIGGSLGTGQSGMDINGKLAHRGPSESIHSSSGRTGGHSMVDLGEKLFNGGSGSIYSSSGVRDSLSSVDLGAKLSKGGHGGSIYMSPGSAKLSSVGLGRSMHSSSHIRGDHSILGLGGKVSNAGNGGLIYSGSNLEGGSSNADLGKKLSSGGHGGSMYSSSGIDSSLSSMGLGGKRFNRGHGESMYSSSGIGGGLSSMGLVGKVFRRGHGESIFSPGLGGGFFNENVDGKLSNGGQRVSMYPTGGIGVDYLSKGLGGHSSRDIGLSMGDYGGAMFSLDGLRSSSLIGGLKNSLYNGGHSESMHSSKVLGNTLVNGGIAGSPTKGGHGGTPGSPSTGLRNGYSIGGLGNGLSHGGHGGMGFFFENLAGGKLSNGVPSYSSRGLGSGLSNGVLGGGVPNGGHALSSLLKGGYGGKYLSGDQGNGISSGGLAFSNGGHLGGYSVGGMRDAYSIFRDKLSSGGHGDTSLTINGLGGGYSNLISGSNLSGAGRAASIFTNRGIGTGYATNGGLLGGYSIKGLGTKYSNGVHRSFSGYP